MPQMLHPDFGVLLVDNEPLWLKSLSLALRVNAGISNLTTCQDSREALQLMEPGAIGLVLLDLNMPRLGGEELLARITERHPGVLVIIISGDSQVEAVVRCIKQGAFDYFVKTDATERIVGGVLRAVRMLEVQRTSRDLAPVSRNPFAGFETLPTFRQVDQFLVEEAMVRAGNHQTLAARLLGISQPAMSKRLKNRHREGA